MLICNSLKRLSVKLTVQASLTALVDELNNESLSSLGQRGGWVIMALRDYVDEEDKGVNESLPHPNEL